MRTLFFLSILFTIIISGCSASELFEFPGSRQNNIDSFSIPQLQFNLDTTNTPLPPTETNTPTSTPTPTKSLTPTPTFTSTPSPTPSSTPTPPPKLNIMIQSCDIGIDLLNNLGEVTNAYITVQNIGERDISDINMLLTANDEQKPYAKRSFTLQYLPADYEITVKLTVDTESMVDTVLTFTLDAEPEVHEKITKEGCTNRIPDFERINSLGSLFKVVPIQ